MVPFVAAAIHRLDDAGLPVIVAEDLTQAADWFPRQYK
jgi:hypothetical protein